MRRVVLGIGNILNRDEGLGVRALVPLRERIAAASCTELLDGGTLGLRLLPIVEECDHLLILDAVDAGKPAGTMIEISREDLPFFSKITASIHEASIQAALGLAKVRGRLPEDVVLLGMQPGDISLGEGLSGVVEAGMPSLVERAREIVASWEAA